MTSRCREEWKSKMLPCSSPRYEPRDVPLNFATAVSLRVWSSVVSKYNLDGFTASIETTLRPCLADIGKCTPYIYIASSTTQPARRGAHQGGFRKINVSVFVSDFIAWGAISLTVTFLQNVKSQVLYWPGRQLLPHLQQIRKLYTRSLRPIFQIAYTKTNLSRRQQAGYELMNMKPPRSRMIGMPLNKLGDHQIKMTSKKSF